MLYYRDNRFNMIYALHLVLMWSMIGCPFSPDWWGNEQKWMTILIAMFSIVHIWWEEYYWIQLED